MDRGQAESNPRNACVGEINEAFTDEWFVEIRKFCGGSLSRDADSSLLIQRIELGEAIRREEFENGQAAAAAEDMVSGLERIAAATCTAVKAICPLARRIRMRSYVVGRLLNCSDFRHV